MDWEMVYEEVLAEAINGPVDEAANRKSIDDIRDEGWYHTSYGTFEGRDFKIMLSTLDDDYTVQQLLKDAFDGFY